MRNKVTNNRGSLKQIVIEKEISQMACSTTSRCSRGHALNSITVIGARISLKKLDKSVGLRQSSTTVIYCGIL